MSHVVIDDLLRTERMDVAAVATLRMTHRDVEVARHLVHFQDAPHHTAFRRLVDLQHIAIPTSTLRSVVLDEPRVPATVAVRGNQRFATVAADVVDFRSEAVAALRSIVLLYEREKYKHTSSRTEAKGTFTGFCSLSRSIFTIRDITPICC